ncbi:hypothetical protein GUJ93_ZPchr0008g12627 [Zizania palustris]|uniref:Uncharacterized protein n=1 Tax=Zizania palustris TaxID=103762 RepID=A0A8J5R9B2_ZIZPA|nr:hypothetical protein GUJ93_ZPchr0008g12627 [Zizania palustris]KAG8045012.1 hypothetical protein GUJ93_ZPchr0008g12627 [Zizania palustris]
MIMLCDPADTATKYNFTEEGYTLKSIGENMHEDDLRGLANFFGKFLLVLIKYMTKLFHL